MKVKKITRMLTAILDLLKDYEEEEFVDILNLLSSKVIVTPSPISTKPQYPDVPHEKSTFDVSMVLGNLELKDRDETKVYLNAFTKNQLLEICSRINIKPRSKDAKSAVITIIADHYGFIKLNQQIASRGSCSFGGNE